MNKEEKHKKLKEKIEELIVLNKKIRQEKIEKEEVSVSLSRKWDKLYDKMINIIKEL